MIELSSKERLELLKYIMENTPIFCWKNTVKESMRILFEEPKK